MTTITRRELMQVGAATTAAVGLRDAKAQVSAGRTVTIEARPQAVSIDTATTAVVVVDMQNDFGTKGGMFDRAGIDISGIQKAVGPTANVLELAEVSHFGVAFDFFRDVCDCSTERGCLYKGSEACGTTWSVDGPGSFRQIWLHVFKATRSAQRR